MRLEHVNFSVGEIEAMLAFLRAAFPDFRVRGEGVGQDDTRWVHVGTEDTYIALFQATAEPDRPRVLYGGEPGMNHVGFEVDDVDSLHRRLSEAGYRESTFPNSHPHRKRVYFLDPEGNEWEFVQYLSPDPAERNDYELPDL
ncbi:MAG: VOC family protein [Planctomycetota bacterium]|jgi:catechol 2,3-dioxygenase-like lactoylglutathione lyase family enzyme